MLFSYREGAPTSPLFIIIPHFLAFVNNCNDFFRNFFSVSSIFLPPAQGGARKRTDARPKAAQAAPMDGEGPAGRTERWEGRGPAGPDARAADKTARATSKQGGGRAAAPPGRGAGGANPHKTRARKPGCCRCFYSIKRPRPDAGNQATKRGHKREKTGKRGTRQDREQSGTGRRPQTPPGGAPHGRWARKPSDD